MRFILAVLLAFSTVLLSATLRVERATENRMPQDDTTQKAKKLWEDAIAAKGGRDRLYAVRNFVVSSRSKYLKAPRDIRVSHFEDFYVLPDQWWNWADYRPGAFGLNIITVDFSRKIAWEMIDKWKTAQPISTEINRPRPDDPYQIYDPDAGMQFASLHKSFREAQITYLMETRWVKPIPSSTGSEKIGSVKVDVVETIVNDYKVDFYLSQVTHLPLRVVIKTRIESSGRDFVRVIRLDDYVGVDGIQMPQRVSLGSDDVNQTRYQINVDYDESIFKRPPTIDMGAEAWKRGRR
jgi:hypothetical protein